MRVKTMIALAALVPSVLAGGGAFAAGSPAGAVATAQNALAAVGFAGGQTDETTEGSSGGIGAEGIVLGVLGLGAAAAGIVAITKSNDSTGG